jgi:osmotically-inducible protein OsmY
MFPTAGHSRRPELESISGEESCERVSGSSVPVAGPAHLSSLFEVGGVDKHNWQWRSDERIKWAVMTALHWDLAVPRDRVQVNVDRGWVTLTGQVRHEYERSRAETDARTTRNVTGVINDIVCRSAE